MKNSELFSLYKTIAAPLILSCEYPWEVLFGIREFIVRCGSRLDKDKFERIGRYAWVAKSAKIAPSACISGAVIIDEGAEMRHGAYIRGDAIIGKGAVVGNSSEVKGSVFFDEAKAPHFNYVGDSVLGFSAHLGAGAVISNLKSDKSEVSVSFLGEKIYTGRHKFGAAVGDGVEIGCGAVLFPGSVIGRGAVIYPQATVRGYVPENTILKSGGVTVKKQL